ncbi:MAG: ABC-2 type transport system permease protein [Myxococcota bacterium]
MSILLIAWRELRALLTSAVGWVVLCGFLFVSGTMWTLSVFGYVAASTDVVYDPYAVSQLTFTGALLGPWFGNISVVLVLGAPALAMRSFSEEIQQHTLELLLTSPVSTLEIVCGKYLGVLGYAALMLAATSYAPLGLYAVGSPDPGAIAAGYLGLLCLSSAIVSLGMMFSAFTASQLTAFVATFSIALGAYLVGVFDPDPDSWLTQLSLATHLMDLFRGAVRLSDLVYFASVTGLFLFATWQRLESFRWR